jgi:hypothetical protein
MRLHHPGWTTGLVVALLIMVGAGIGELMLSAPAAAAAEHSSQAEISDLEREFRNPPDDSKIMVRWWWFGPAVTRDEVDREMRAMRDAGIGGVEVSTVYPLTVDDPTHGLTNLRFLSAEHLAVVSNATQTARQLGLRMDMTMGSGWPFGGPHITPDLASQRLRCVHVALAAGERRIPAPPLQDGQQFIAAFISAGDGRPFDMARVARVSPEKDGSFVAPSQPAPARELLFFVSELTGQKVKRPALGAEGLVLDHYSRAALEKHLAAVGAPLAAAGGGNMRAMFCDSLEVFEADWTPGLLEEFRRRRGYDLTPYLPALETDYGTRTRSVRHDWGETLSELFNQNFLEPFQAWCHQHYLLSRVQAYGQPPAQLSSYRFVDLPEGEQGDNAGHWNQFTPARWASSAGHFYGAPIISAEAFTWIHSLPFRATPLDFKAMADEYFLEGINQLVVHGWPYSPPGQPEPGWHFYAAGAMNAHNPWWFAMPDLAQYLARASFVLRQGRPANDIAVYLPTHDAWASFSPGQVNLWQETWRRLGPDLLPALLEAGYNLDFVDDEILERQGHVEGGKLVVADEAFPIVILPGIERIPPATLAKMGEFARSGGVLLATRRLPSLAPGLLHQQPDSAEVARQVDEIFRRPSSPGHFVADERRQFEEELARLETPDVVFSPPSPHLGFIHRHLDSAEIYFLANTLNQRVESTATFRVQGKSPEYWDMFTGQVSAARVLGGGGKSTAISLALEPYGSRLLVFTNRKPAEASAPPPVHLDALDLSRDWQVTFEGTDRQVNMEFLRSWTEIEGLKYFSGRAVYQRQIDIPEAYLRPGRQMVLSLGDSTPIPIQNDTHYQAWLEAPVREAAEVYLNGRCVGTVWHPPYELDVTPFLHRGENELRIVVGNTAVNQMAGRTAPDRSALTARFGERFEDQGKELMQPPPSGLLGPIRLIPRARQDGPQ